MGEANGFILSLPPDIGLAAQVENLVACQEPVLLALDVILLMLAEAFSRALALAFNRSASGVPIEIGP